MGEIKTLRLSRMSKEMKLNLAAIAGYKIVELIPDGKCYIMGADSWCENNFKSVDEVLKMIQSDLYKYKYKVVAA
jgi:hypothetical protein